MFNNRHLFVAEAVLLILLSLSPLCPSAMAQAHVEGQWSTLPYPMPINPIHASLLHTGQVLVVSGSGNVASNTDYLSAIWDPQAGSVTLQASNDLTVNAPITVSANGHGGALTLQAGHSIAITIRVG